MAGRHSPLYDWHVKHGARFRMEGGWEVPDLYSTLEEECQALQDGAGIYDLCHEGRIRISGADRIAALDELVTSDITALPVNAHQTMLLCNDRGGIIDEVNIFKGDNFLLVQCHAGVRQTVLDWLKERMTGRAVELVDNSNAQVAIGIRGKQARNALEATLMNGHLDMPAGRGDIVTIGTARCMVLRQQQAGIDTYTVVVGSLYLSAVWDRIFIGGGLVRIKATGEAARDAFRLEAGLPRQGTEMDTNTNPVELGLGLRMDLRKPSFTGRQAILHAATAEFARRLVALRLETPVIAKPGSTIEFQGMPVGFVTSSGLNPAGKRGLAMGFVEANRAKPGTRLQVRVDGQLQNTESVYPQTMLET